MCTMSSMMTQTANQYLRPEYLPLDANKSPLALLAKTCSSIGVDTPSVKSLTGSSSNSSSSSSTNSLSNERRTTPKSKSADSNDASSSKLNFKPYELSSKNKSHDGEKNTADKATLSSNSHSKANSSSPSASQTSPDPQKQQANASNSAPLSYTSLGLPDMHKDSLAAFYKTYGFLSPNCCPTTPGSPYASLMPPPITLDKTGAYPSIYPPTPSATAAAALAAYNYARVKGAMPGMVSGASNALQCRDPYCGGACGQFGPLHNSHAALLAASQASLALRDAVHNQSPCTPATCPNGCNQCEHQRYLAAIAAYGNTFPGLASGMPYPQQLSASYASSLAAAAALHHRTASNVGNVCNWVVGEHTHCGKRFATSEELLQHLKSHTASTQSSNESRTSPPTSAPTAHLSSSNSPAVSAAAQHQSGTHSPHSQSVRHSTSSSAATVSPSSGSHSLSQLHNSRYHPYSKPISSVAPSLPPSAQASAAYQFAANGASTPAYPHPYGLSPATSLPSFAASSMYYPYMQMSGMTPGFFSSRIGPPVPP